MEKCLVNFNNKELYKEDKSRHMYAVERTFMSKEEFKNPHPELPVREPVLRLGKMITDRVPIKLGFEKLTADSPEYWGLAPICTDEQAEIALKMGVRKPKTLKQMVKITGMEEKELEKQLEQMAFNGLLEYNWENEQHEKQYVLPMFVPGSAEFTNMNSTVLEEHPEMGRFFERMSRLPLEKITPMVPPGGAGIGMHVIPVEKAIDMNNQAISLEKISYWLDKYEGKYADIYMGEQKKYKKLKFKKRMIRKNKGRYRFLYTSSGHIVYIKTRTYSGNNKKSPWSKAYKIKL